MNALAASEAYPLWAPTYSDETAISFLEDRLVRVLTPPLAGRRLLDAGCGTGRRIRGTNAAAAVGLEPCREMLAAGIAADGPPTGVDLVVGDMRDMPLQSGAFDVVWEAKGPIKPDPYLSVSPIGGRWLTEEAVTA